MPSLPSVALAFLGVWFLAASSEAQAQSQPIRRIAFGSCIRQDRAMPIWDAVRSSGPDVTLLIGDNIYGDSDDPNVLEEKYRQLAVQPGFQAVREASHLLATWDDHDYGRNDAGAEYPTKRASQQLFLDFLGVPEESPRRKREGIYHAEVMGPPGQRVQFLMLDTRYHRSALRRTDTRVRGLGPYIPAGDPDLTMLGEAQWEWLEEQLRVPAEVRILATSIQLVSDRHGWEAWINLPRERERLLRLIGETRAGGVIAISGDRHSAEISRLEPRRDGRGAGYPIYDVTSSSMNAGRSWSAERNPHRVGDLYGGNNFGFLEIEWAGEDTRVRASIHDEGGRPVLRADIELAELQPPPLPERSSPQLVQRIAFGSCNQQTRPTPLWTQIRAEDPDLFVFLGDNIYGDTDDMVKLKAAYDGLAVQNGFAELRSEVPILATWDDHDYGSNDAGKEWPKREASKELFLEFFGEGQDSPLRTRSGIYSERCFGPEHQRVQIILLDLRTHRDPWGRRSDRAEPGDGRPGSYAPNTTPGATILGEEQWTWLEERLRVPAQLRIIGSSLQCLSQGHNWECWDMMPAERTRLLSTLREADAQGVILLSGDTHWAELSRLDPEDSGLPYPLWELTSSGLNQGWEYTNIHNPHRVDVPYWAPNYGMVRIDWEAQEVTLEACNQKERVLRQALRFNDLRRRSW